MSGRLRSRERGAGLGSGLAIGVAPARPGGPKGARGGPMEEIAPEAVTVAARLRAPEERAVRAHEGVVRTLARRQMRLTPLHIENFLLAVGERLAARTVGASYRGLLRREVCHDPGLDGTRRRRSSAPMLAVDPAGGEEKYLGPRMRRLTWTWAHARLTQA